MEQYDLAVIGGGPAGYFAAERASAVGMKTVLFEADKLGGVCLNEGCIPTKVMLNTSKLLYYAKNGGTYGIRSIYPSAVLPNAFHTDAPHPDVPNPTAHPNVSHTDGVTFAIDHAAVLARKEKVVRTLVAGVRSKLKAAGADVRSGKAEIGGARNNRYIITQTTGDESGREIDAARVLLATGSAPAIPPIANIHAGIESGFIITSREALSLTEIPEKLIIVGGGVIGLELADYFNAAGSDVTVVEMLDRAAFPMDADVIKVVVSGLQKRGVAFRFGSRLTEIIQPDVDISGIADAQKGQIRVDSPSGSETIPVDKVLIAVGRRPNISGANMDKLGICVERGAIVTDGDLRTNIPNVYAAGDVNGRMMLAHTAYLESERAVSHMLGKPGRMRYGAIPSVVYTNPEAACAGETEESATDKGLSVKAINIPLTYSGRYVAESGGGGICKVLLDKKNGTVAGVHIAGTYASEIILSAALMVEGRWTAEALKGIAFPHPTVGEAIREALYMSI